MSATRHADLLRRAVGLAGQVHDPAHALDDEVVAGARRVGAVLAEAGDRAIDQPRVERLEARRNRARICASPPTLKFSITTSASARAARTIGSPSLAS